jgi:hypothetical protein
LEGPKITSNKNVYNIVSEKEISLKWNSIEGAKNYKIKIVRLQDPTNSPVLEKVLDDTDYEGPAPKEGQYKWILTAIDKFGRDSKPTEKNFRVIESKKLAPPEFEMQGVQ